jgi:hypothetical protein
MAYPGPKVHRVSRRKLGRGQYPNSVQVTVTAATTTPNVTLTFSSPVVFRNANGFAISGQTIVSASQTSPTTVEIVMSGTTTSAAYTFNGSSGGISSASGGAINSIAGTF